MNNYEACALTMEDGVSLRPYTLRALGPIPEGNRNQEAVLRDVSAGKYGKDIEMIKFDHKLAVEKLMNKSPTL